MANRVGKFRTNIAAVAGSCDCVQLGGFGDVVGKFHTNIAAVAGSCDCVQLGGFGDVVGKFRTNVAAVAGSCDCSTAVWATSWDNSAPPAPTLRPLPDHVIVFNWVWATSWDNSALTLWPLPIM